MRGPFREGEVTLVQCVQFGFMQRIKMANAIYRKAMERVGVCGFKVQRRPPLPSPVYTFSNNVVFHMKMPTRPAAMFA